MSKHIRSTSQNGFFRCDVKHTFKGQVFASDAFEPDEWKTLEADPMLVVSDADEVDQSDQDAPDELSVLVGEAIKQLYRPDNRGKPTIEAIKELLAPDMAEQVTAQLRDAVLKELKESGFPPPPPKPKD